MRIFHAAQFTLPLPAGHRFPMQKYRLLQARVAAAAPAAGWHLHEAPLAGREVLCAVHTPAYVTAVCNGTLTAAAQRRIGLPWSVALVERARRSVGATLAACAAALEDAGVAVSLAGGTHHAGRDRGAGFCVFNDVAIAARQALATGAAERVLIVDCDVHQGDGTAELLAGQPGCYTFSMHAARNFPHDKPASDCDIALPDSTGAAEYLDLLGCGLDYVFARARPHLVLYLAGADVYVGDRLGRLALDKDAIAARDALVCDATARAGAALAVVMGGGYADDPAEIVDIHFNTVRCAARHRHR